MEIFLEQYEGKPSVQELANLRDFLLWEPLGREWRFALARSLVNRSPAAFQSVLNDPNIAKALL